MLPVECLMTRSRDVMALHKFLGEVLRTFQDSPLFRWAYDRNGAELFVSFEIIIYAFNQWVFWTYDNHIDGLVQHELTNSREVIGFYCHILSHLTSPGITWGYIQLFQLLALCQFPSNGVLTATTS